MSWFDIADRGAACLVILTCSRRCSALSSACMAIRECFEGTGKFLKSVVKADKQLARNLGERYLQLVSAKANDEVSEAFVLRSYWP